MVSSHANQTKKSRSSYLRRSLVVGILLFASVHAETSGAPNSQSPAPSQSSTPIPASNPSQSPTPTSAPSSQSPTPKSAPTPSQSTTPTSASPSQSPTPTPTPTQTLKPTPAPTSSQSQTPPPARTSGNRTSSNASTAGTSQPNQLKIMSFNVRTAAAHDDRPSWQERSQRAEDVLKDYAPDFIGTQETFVGNPNQRDFFLTHGYDCLETPKTDKDEVTEIFFKKDKFTVLSKEHFPLESVKYKRIVSIGRFQPKSSSTSGGTLCYVNAHFDTDGGQPKSAEIIMNKMNSVCTKDDLVVLTGDLNVTPETPAVQYLYGKGGNAKNPMPLVETMNDPAAFTDRGVANFKAGSAAKKIDYIMARPDVNLCVLNGELIDRDGVTDHKVLMTTFCVGGSCPKDKCKALK